MGNWDERGLDSALLFEEALASVQSGDGLEGYADEDLAKLDARCEKLLELSAMLDIHGDIVGVPGDMWLEARQVQRALRAERRTRDSLDVRL